jgi:hypothetical protein
MGIRSLFFSSSPREKACILPRRVSLVKRTRVNIAAGTAKATGAGLTQLTPVASQSSRFQADGLKRIQFRKEVMAAPIQVFRRCSIVNSNKEKEK